MEPKDLEEQQKALREGLAERLYDRNVDAGHPPSFDLNTNLVFSLLPDYLKQPYYDLADGDLAFLSEQGLVFSTRGEWFDVEHHCLNCHEAYEQGFKNATAPLTSEKAGEPC